MKAALKEAGTDVAPDEVTGGGFTLLGPDSGKVEDPVTDKPEDVELQEVGKKAGQAALKAFWKEYLYPIIKFQWFNGRLTFGSGWSFVKSRPIFSTVLGTFGLLGGGFYIYDLYDNDKTFPFKFKFDLGPFKGTCETEANLRDPKSDYKFSLELKVSW